VTPRICVSILPKNNAEALRLIERAESARVDFIEVRLDSLEFSRKLSDLTASTKIPLIATNKPQTEKGFFVGTETERQHTIFDAAKNGFQYIDVDFNNPKRNEIVTQIKALSAKPIVSYHKYDGSLTFSTMEKILDEQIGSGADVCKIVINAKQIEDNLPILSFVSFASAKTKLVCFCMGELGKVSRLLSPAFGAFFTFAALEKGMETAVGQMSISEMQAAYSLLGMQ
jgi:3-dehydroquinate dehydratase type I